MRLVKAGAGAGKLSEPFAALNHPREADLARAKAHALTQRLKEARYAVAFCRAVYAHLDPADVCSTAAWLNDCSPCRLALFSFARNSEQESLAFVPTRSEGEGTELQRLGLGALHAGPSERGVSGRSTGVMEAEVRLSLPEGLG